MFAGPPPLHETEISTALVTWSSSGRRAGPRSHGASWFPYWVGISYCPHLSSYRSRPTWSLLQGPGSFGVPGQARPSLYPQIYTHRLSHPVRTEGQQLGPYDASASGCGCQLLSPARCSLEMKEPKESMSDLLSLCHSS